MSYILDALKKADAERARGQSRVPGLHANPAPMVEEATDAPAWSGGGAIWAVAALLGLLVVLLGWRLLTADPPAAATPLPSTAQVPAAPTQPAPVLRDASPAPAGATPAAPADLSDPAPLPKAETTAPGTPAAAVTRSTGVSGGRVASPVARQPEARPASNPAAPAASGGASLPATAAAPRSAEPVYTLQTLPDALRRDLPPLTVGGAMHSDVPAQRMLILNSQVFREGDQPVPDLVLEEIRLRSAVFRFRGSRFSVAY